MSDLHDMEWAELVQECRKLRKALKPFTSPDLHQYLGGNAEGEDSIVFQRQKTQLTIGDFKLAAKTYANL